MPAAFASAAARARVRVLSRASRADDARVRVDLVVILASVAAAVRAGVGTGDAWKQWDVTLDECGVPHLADLAAATERPRKGSALAHLRHLRAIQATCAVAHDLGSPLGDVLDDLARSVQGHQSAVAARRTALAGPKASARVLMWLPAATCLLGVVLGAQPWEVLFAGGVGALSLVAGGLALLVGWRWVSALVERAAKSADSSPQTRRGVSSQGRTPDDR